MNTCLFSWLHEGDFLKIPMRGVDKVQLENLTIALVELVCLFWIDSPSQKVPVI